MVLITYAMNKKKLIRSWNKLMATPFKEISMRQLSHNFFPQKSVLQEIKNFQSIKASTSENADERPGAIYRDAKAALFPTVKKSWLTALQTHFKARVKYFRFFHHLTSSLVWISIWRNPDQMITALLRAIKRTLWKKSKKIFSVPYVIYR